jgi:hypothetical protein
VFGDYLRPVDFLFLPVQPMPPTLSQPNISLMLIPVLVMELQLLLVRPEVL